MGLASVLSQTQSCRSGPVPSQTAMVVWPVRPPVPKAMRGSNPSSLRTCRLSPDRMSDLSIDVSLLNASNFSKRPAST